MWTTGLTATVPPKAEAHPDIATYLCFFSVVVKFLTSKCAMGGVSGFA